MKAALCHVLAVACFICWVSITSAKSLNVAREGGGDPAAPMSSFVHYYAYGGDPHAVKITVTVYDNYEGNCGRYCWIYEVVNNSYDPSCYPFASNGFSGFLMYLDYVDIYEIGNIESPGPGWVIGGQYPLPINWDIVDADGIMPGESGTFSFTTLPRYTGTMEGYFNTRCFGVPIKAVYFTTGDGPEGPGALKSSACDDGDTCTIDVCDPTLPGCEHVPLPDCPPGDCDGSICDDGDPCTIDFCEAGLGACVHLPMADCPPDYCDDPSCNDGDPCTVDYCDPNTGDCVNLDIPNCPPEDEECPDEACDDGNSCTVDFCEPALNSCMHLEIAGCPPELIPDNFDQRWISPQVPLPVPLIPFSPAPVIIHQLPTAGGLLVGRFLPSPVLTLPIPFQVNENETGSVFSGQPVATDPAQFWSLEFQGTLEGAITLEFSYVPGNLRSGVDENLLAIYQATGGDWMMLPGVVDTVANSITVTTSSLTLFALALNPVASGVMEAASRVPVASLGTPLPNPSNASTMLQYSVTEACRLSLAVYDVTGRFVATLTRGESEAGTFTMTWSGNDEFGREVASGVYFVRLQVGNFTATRKVVLLR